MTELQPTLGLLKVTEIIGLPDPEKYPDYNIAKILPIEIPIELPVITIPLPEIIKKIGEEELCHEGIQSLEKTLELDTLGSGILRGSIIGIITGIIVGIILMKVIK